jgi:hypothetical protein
MEKYEANSSVIILLSNVFRQKSSASKKVAPWSVASATAISGIISKASKPRPPKIE